MYKSSRMFRIDKSTRCWTLAHQGTEFSKTSEANASSSTLKEERYPIPTTVLQMLKISPRTKTTYHD